MGAYSYVVNDSNIIYSEIGKFCSIASHVRINPGNHPTRRASQYHFQYRAASYDLGDDEVDFFDWCRRHKIALGHDVWIGHGVILLPGVEIATGSVVGAGAVVTKDVAPYTIVAGIPAKPIRPRTDKTTAEALMKMAWWDWPHDRLRHALHDFRNLAIVDFVKKYG